MSFTLRDYQGQCSDAIIEKWRTHKSTLLVMATGLGKTVIFANVIKRMHPGRALVLANREELIFQASNQIQKTTGLHCEIEMADLSASSSLFNRADVIVSTVQTQISGKERKRMHRFKPEDFAVLVIDEAHMSVASSFKSVISHYSKNPFLKVLGVTATPDRHDRESLGQIFESVAANYGILDGIHGGWLCDITQQFVPVAGLDYSHVRTTAGDLNGGDLAAVMEAENNIMGVCHPSLEVMFGLPPKTLSPIPVPDWGKYLESLGRKARRTIVFTASVAQAEMCCNIFNRVVPGIADWVCGTTDKEKRRSLLKRFSEGQVRAVMNCGVLTHGFDDPGVEVIIMARPTKSRSLYAQMVGRSTRALPGVVDQPELDTPEKRITAIAASAKPFCRIIDFVGNAGKHKLITTCDILGGRVSEAAAEKARAQALIEGKPVRMAKLLDKAEVEVKLKQEEEAERRRKADAARRSHLVAKSRFSVQDINPFDLLDVTPASPYSRGFAKPPTPKMVEFLKRRGIDAFRHHLNFNKAGEMISKIRKLEDSSPASIKQLNFMRWKNIPFLPNITKKQASKLIDEHERNNDTNSRAA